MGIYCINYCGGRNIFCHYLQYSCTLVSAPENVSAHLSGNFWESTPFWDSGFLGKKKFSEKFSEILGGGTGVMGSWGHGVMGCRRCRLPEVPKLQTRQNLPSYVVLCRRLCFPMFNRLTAQNNTLSKFSQ